MNSVALLLVLAAAAFHAGWNRLLHDTEERVAAMAIAGLTGCFLLSPTIVHSPPLHAGWLIPLSAVAEAAYALALTTAYRHGALSLAYPIGRGTAPLLVTLGGWFVLSQHPSPLEIAGAAALGLGLVVVATAGKHPDRRIAIGFAVLTGCCIATYSLIDARAVQSTFPPAYLGAVLGLEGLLLIGWLRGDWKRLRAALKPGIIIGAGTIGSYLLVLFAFQRANAGPVATLREVSVLLGLVLARDKPGPRAWLGGTLVVAGAILAAV